MKMPNLDEVFRIVHEIADHWVIVKGRVRIYIAETASKGFMTFSLHDGSEENDYEYFSSHDTARKYIRKKYDVTGRMKKVSS
jgi:hypothetical protein